MSAQARLKGVLSMDDFGESVEEPENSLIDPNRFNRLVQVGLVGGVGGVRKHGESDEEFQDRMNGLRLASLDRAGIDFESVLREPSQKGSDGRRRRIDTRTPQEKRRAEERERTKKRGSKDDRDKSATEYLKDIADSTGAMARSWGVGE